MGYIPIFLDVTGRECVVVGGGEVAARKAEALLEAGARVTVVSPRLSPPLEAWRCARAGRRTSLANINAAISADAYWYMLQPTIRNCIVSWRPRRVRSGSL